MKGNAIVVTSLKLMNQIEKKSLQKNFHQCTRCVHQWSRWHSEYRTRTSIIQQ